MAKGTAVKEKWPDLPNWQLSLSLSLTETGSSSSGNSSDLDSDLELCSSDLRGLCCWLPLQGREGQGEEDEEGRKEGSLGRGAVDAITEFRKILDLLNGKNVGISFIVVRSLAMDGLIAKPPFMLVHLSRGDKSRTTFSLAFVLVSARGETLELPFFFCFAKHLLSNPAGTGVPSSNPWGGGKVRSLEGDETKDDVIPHPAHLVLCMKFVHLSGARESTLEQKQ
ncbi:hypothetical protein AXG93_2742s1050 [Marchantia polymorpha subsp. ruderalis]|uniref:Uncharacterized protein n=1 Tax=Marchantia polymorpha subsp. ruderalis TaxID=1480154 RepID=A0A176VIB5_MARPO|nr:hypothetical protein AXG93_2742s1050 [Marchantia polymorpha subsp. ruderalis]